MGHHLLNRVEALQDEFNDVVSNARGRGLLCSFDLPTAKERDDIVNKIIENGAIILGCGEKTIRFRPSLTITTDDIDKGIDCIEKSLKSYYS